MYQDDCMYTSICSSTLMHVPPTYNNNNKHIIIIIRVDNKYKVVLTN